MTREISLSELVQKFDQWVTEDRSILFITGAGVSAESGIPTYRGDSGLYNEPDEETGLPMEVIMSGETWQTNPELLMKHLRKVADNCSSAKPNEAHRFISALEERLSRVWVLTQNVDGLHRKAGSKNVIEIHGNAFTMECTAFEEHSWEVSSYDEIAGDIRCPHCGSAGRPAVVLFGESLPDVAVETYERELERGFDVVISVGTSHMLPYIDHPVFFGGAWETLVLNPQPVPIEELAFDYAAKFKAAEALGHVAQNLPGF